MLALVMPLPSISRFSMPTPFGNQHSHTWALCHGTTFSSAQLILLEGKIRPANWTYPQKSTEVPPSNLWGILSLAEKFPMRIQQFQHGWKRSSLTPSRRKQRANKASLWARCSEEPVNILGSRAEATKKPKSTWLKREWSTRLRSTRLPTATTVGLHFIALKWADLKGSRKSEQKTKEIDLRDSDSEDYTYRGNEERRRRR
ncbi:uncharacterized protein LOC122955037 [Acropora millepora]|uniref:uncharacterized protein LOC122955037 n=1 Tax=Acropora millepora TaxID=45264 RepID=UPI001CF5699F|nr:uncharacterized protein LOC122955037 [Acropora millepora]